MLAEKRDVHREVSIEEIGASLDRSAARFQDIFADQGASPSDGVDQHERLLAVSAALSRLPDSYRQVIVLRHLEGCSFADVGQRLGRTAGACRMLWLRAIESMRESLSEEGWS